MKVYAKLTFALCTNPNPRCDYYTQGDDYEECPYYDSTHIIRDCYYSEPTPCNSTDEMEQLTADQTCKHTEWEYRTIAKECASVDIRRNTCWPWGDVEIDGEVFDLENVNLLKVDYGEGWVSEWPMGDPEDNDNE